MYRSNLSVLRCPVCGGENPLLCEDVFSKGPDGEIVDGVLSCADCKRWYRVEEGIPDLVRDALREPERDRDFLGRHRELLARRASVDEPVRSSDDQRIVDEGIHWGRFMRHFWDAGDRSIFDIRCKGSHPPLYIAGVLECDDRDRYRRWGIFPNRTGDLLFAGLNLLKGKRGLDIGCGGGQFGLEAAQQGVEMIGFDPSFEEVRLARLHARDCGVTNIDYVRAEPAHAPFTKGAFALLMAKDSLHHVPNLAENFPSLVALGSSDCVLVLHEHVARARLKDRLLQKIARPAVEKIRRRYAKNSIPEELLRDSANEDVSSADVRPLARKYFQRIDSAEDLFFASDVEMYLHFAFGRRRWISLPAYGLGFVVEKILLACGQRQHFSFTGKRKNR